MLFRRGSKGENVKLIQRAMKIAFEQVGVKDCFDDLAADGDYGRHTEKCVIQSQINMGIGIDGVVGNEFLGSIGLNIPTPKATGKITYEMLVDASGRCPSDMFAPILQEMNDCCEVFGMESAVEIAHFLAQLGHESHFEITDENLYYSTGRMQTVFGNKGRRSYREKLFTQPDKYKGNPVALGSYVYCCRMGNGSEESQDGYKYRARGMGQTTGFNNYKQLTETYAKYYPSEAVDFTIDPDAILTPRNAVRSAFIFWKDNGFSKIIANGASVEKVTRKFNGGTNGLVDRERRFDRLSRALTV